MLIKQPDKINVISEQFKMGLNENNIFQELTEMVEFKVANDKTHGRYETRPVMLNPLKRLTDEQERNEQFAEAVAKKLGLEYYQQSCIAGNKEELDKLKLAKAILSKRMETDDIEPAMVDKK